MGRNSHGSSEWLFECGNEQNQVCFMHGVNIPLLEEKRLKIKKKVRKSLVVTQSDHFGQIFFWSICDVARPGPPPLGPAQANFWIFVIL